MRGSKMILLIECIVCCLIFTCVILPAQYKDPIVMIASYPPEVIRRVESLPQYKGTIKQREKSHIKKENRRIAAFCDCVIPCCLFFRLQKFC
jgi:hypothetical protein